MVTRLSCIAAMLSVVGTPGLCDEPSATGPHPSVAEDQMPKTPEEVAQFSASFAKKLYDACVNSFTASGGPGGQSAAYCRCVVDRINPMSVQEKVGLTSDPNKLHSIANVCLSDVARN